ncbi:hypothetical protein L596_026628 [Steinernema carpocapsae]|uniref:Uncharacterized protein n=1 Tax=Steinernema carpocapsae TaxID=34508 RepID=A0A4U5M201_STECR|nr:hypothetical protein L596_026628 [Steinernema carpocapsae]
MGVNQDNRDDFVAMIAAILGVAAGKVVTRYADGALRIVCSSGYAYVAVPVAGLIAGVCLVAWYRGWFS